MGYARWILPRGTHSTTWLEAQVLEASDEESEVYEKAFKAVSTENGKMRGSNLEMSSVTGKKLYEEEQLAMRYMSCVTWGT